MAGENATAELPSYKPSSAAARKLLNERTKSLVDLADTWIADDTPAAGPQAAAAAALVPDDGTAAGLGAAPGPAGQRPRRRRRANPLEGHRGRSHSPAQSATTASG